MLLNKIRVKILCMGKQSVGRQRGNLCGNRCDQDYYSGNLPSEEELAKALKKLSRNQQNHSPIQNDSLFHYDKRGSDQDHHSKDQKAVRA